MYLEVLSVQNYRSISSVTLSPCGNFNVLIGKNNSGKSNILSSIAAFFTTISSDILVAEPSLGDEIDFFNRETEGALSIRCVLAPTKAELADLLKRIAEERPQLRSVVDSLEPELRLSITVTVHAPPKKYSYIKNISLVRRDTHQNGHVLLDVSEACADSMYDITRQIRVARNNKEALQKLLRRIETPTPGMRERPIDYTIARILPSIDDFPQQLNDELMRASREADGFTEFQANLAQMIAGADSGRAALESRPLTVPIKTFSGDENIIPRYIRHLADHIGKLKVLYLTERRKAIGTEEAARLLSLKVKRGGTESLSRIQSVVHDLLGVRVDAFQADESGKYAPELDVDDFLIQVNGSGIREALRLILDTEFQEPQILLVEEPEIHLHPALETSIMRYLKSVSATRCQVFLTTHSTNFLDTGAFDNVFMVSKTEHTAISTLTFAEAEERLPEELGIRLSSLFMFDQIVFVEGPSDEQIIRAFASNLSVNLGALNVGFIPMKGVRNIGHYAATEVIAFLAKRRVRLIFLVDSDESNSIHFIRIQKEFKDIARLHVLEKREIENYLLSPDANIAYLIARKRIFGDKIDAPNKEETEASFAQCADQLKPTAIWKRIAAAGCRPVYPDLSMSSEMRNVEEMKARVRRTIEVMKERIEEIEGGLDQLCDTAADDVEQRWANKKLDIVPGSNLLDCWYQQFGLRFDKMRDGPAIAALIKPNEINLEITQFIFSLGTTNT
jgi:ABC-type cobalamin/Fe3+-siderophores transport system ATPase subunit